jgi:CheY-like chemotaxis protein
VGRLAGGVAHDFNNALSVILGHAEMALKRINPTDDIRRDLETIIDATLRSAKLTRQLLAFARKQAIAPKVLDLNDAVAGMLKMLRRLIGEDIQLAWVPGAALWPVKLDPAQIDQLLANLLVNARDAIGGVGKVTVETQNATMDEASCAGQAGGVPGEYVLLAVSDDGCGMAKDVLDHLFEPFFTTKPVGQGTGLGLATVYGIVKQNSGLINVESEPGKGTTFKLYLPRAVGEVPDAQAARVAPEPRGHGETILLVEDEPAMLAVGAETLADLGYSVLIAGRPSEALKAAQAHAGEIQLLITDVVMPEMNGKDLAARLAESRPGMRCLFVSGYTADVIATRGVLDEGVRFLQKPFSRRDLAVKVREALTD